MTLSIYKPVQKFEEMAVDFPGSSSVTSRSMILRGDWLPAVWYCMEIDSVQYDTAGDSKQCRRFQNFWKSPGNLNQNQKYVNPLISGPGRLEWWKKNVVRQSRWTVPLRPKTIFKNSNTVYKTKQNKLVMWNKMKCFWVFRWKKKIV